MAGNKYLATDATTGGAQEIAANQTSAGAGDAGKIVALNSAGLIDNTMLPDVEALSFTAGEAISAGAFVYIKSDGKAWNANASSGGNFADGFAPAAIGSGSSGTINFGGVNSALSGMTVGAAQFLDTTAGGRTETAPTATGQLVQYLGKAISATQLAYEPGRPIKRA